MACPVQAPAHPLSYNIINMFESGVDLVNEFPNVELHRITLKVDNTIVMLPELEPPQCHTLAAVAA
jgi:hypothetical protein